MSENEQLVQEFLKAEEFMMNLLDFFLNMENRSNNLETINELLSFNKQSKFLILPTQENILPIHPDKLNNSIDFYPFKKDPDYFIQLGENYRKLQSLNEPLLIEFLCSDKNSRKFNKKFILKSGTDVKNEILFGNFINFINSILSQDRIMNEMEITFPSYSIIQLTRNVIIIEFLENSNSFESVYQKYLQENYSDLSQNRALL